MSYETSITLVNQERKKKKTIANCTHEHRFKNSKQGFPGGAVVKNPPANAGDTGSIPGQENKILHATQCGQKTKTNKQKTRVTHSFFKKIEQLK